jgi:hypothetical protein
MIDILSLTDADRGRWVVYSGYRGYRERGRLKSWNSTYCWIVFRCGDRWDDFEQYTAAPCLPTTLSFERSPHVA